MSAAGRAAELAAVPIGTTVLLNAIGHWAGSPAVWWFSAGALFVVMAVFWEEGRVAQRGEDEER